MRPQPIPIILLTNQTQKIEPAVRQIALGNGAVDIVPAFNMGTFAIETVNALKAIAHVVEGLKVDNKILVSCIMDLKREIATETSTPATSSPTVSAAVPPQVPEEEEVLPAKNPPKSQHKRTYRGRTY